MTKHKLHTQTLHGLVHFLILASIGIFNSTVLDGNILISEMVIITTSPKRFFGKATCTIKVLLLRVISSSFLSTTLFYSGVWGHDVLCRIPSSSKNSLNSSLENSFVLFFLFPDILTQNTFLLDNRNYSKF